MSKSTVEIELDGTIFFGWKRQALDFDMESVSSSFDVYGLDTDNMLGDLTSSVPCEVFVVNDNQRTLVLSGYTVERERSLTATTNDITFGGNDKLIDLVECSTILKSRTWTNKLFSHIVKELAKPFDITVDTTGLTADERIKRFSVQSSETAFDTIERLCRSQAVLPQSSFGGELHLVYSAAENDRAVENLVVGENVKSISETTSWADRFSEYVALSQSSGNGKRWTKAMIQGKATAEDRGVTRYRPKLFIAERRSDHDTLLKRVAWEAQVRAGRGTYRSVVTNSWFQKDSDGNNVGLWEKNKRVNLVVPEWKIDEDVLITSVSFSLDESGEQTVLGLRHPDTYKEDPTQKIDMT